MKNDNKTFIDKIGLANLLNLDEIVAEDEARKKQKELKKEDESKRE